MESRFELVIGQQHHCYNIVMDHGASSGTCRRRFLPRTVLWAYAWLGRIWPEGSPKYFRPQTQNMSTFSRPTRKSFLQRRVVHKGTKATKLPRFSALHHDSQFFTNAPFRIFLNGIMVTQLKKNRSMTTIHQLLLCRSHTLCSLDKPTGMPSASKSEVVVQPNRFCFSESPATFLVFV